MTVTLDLDRDAAEEALEGLAAEGQVAYTAEYAVHINFDTAYTGTQPPFDPLRRWVHLKWNDLGSGLKEAAIEDSDIEPNSERHKDAVTWMVIAAIAANGIEGVHFADRAFSAGIKAAPQIAKKYQGSDDPDAGFKIIQDIIDFMFGKSQDIIADEATNTGHLLQSGQVRVERGEL